MMTAYNVVRLKAKPGMEQKLIDMHKNMPMLAGMKEAALIKTGDRSYCLIGKWNSMDDIVAARPKMIGVLDEFRGLLEDLGGGLGVTDPVSGSTIFEKTA
jgi:hypothetical protein